MAELMTKLSEFLTCSFLELVKGLVFFKYWKGVFLYEAARTYAILQGIREAPSGTT